MRSPDAALIRARAKAPPPDLLALHLSSADIECIKHLDLCKCLQSLYADNNHIKDLEGIIDLRKLWRIDLNGNLLKNLHALSSFRSLGFLYLERNRIFFEDLVCLRDVHLLEVRLLGNTGLLKGNTLDQYRKKVVALLPNAWILDGHFISSAERQQAIEEFDPFVLGIFFAEPKRSAASDRKFGSVTDVWVESEISSEDTSELSRVTSLIEIAHNPAHSTEPPDLRRLHAIVSFHNAECTLHNSHCHFAPYRQSPNARLMPMIWLAEVFAFPRRTRIEVIVLLATFLEFHFPKVLLTEALTITQLDSPHFPSEAIRDIVNLPPYALVALIATARHFTIEEELSMPQNCRPEVASSDFEDESEVLESIPPLLTTLISMKDAPKHDSGLQARAKRCQRAIKLLSNVASFPDLDTVTSKGKGKRESIFRELLPLIRGAESAPASPATEVVVPTIIVSRYKTAETFPTSSVKLSWKRNTIDQDCDNQGLASPPLPPEEESEKRQFTASLTRTEVFSSADRRKPKPGDWVEVSLKQFVKILFLSADGRFVVGSLPSNESRTIAISLQQMTRVSNTVWRVNSLTRHQMEELSVRKNSSDSPVNSTRIGKLHRDSEAFHRHGAARNQGFPNHFVTPQMLKELNPERNCPASQAKAVEIFSSNDTLDANYVLTSPDHISAQNYCSFLQQRQAPRGLWSPVKQPAPFTVLGGDYQTAPLAKSASLTELKMRKPQVQQRSVQQPNDWLEIRRAMQAHLGIVDDTERPRTAFVYAVEAAAPLPTEERAVRERSRLKTPQRTSIGGAKWHQVATKNEFVVANAALGVSRSVPALRPMPTKGKWRCRYWTREKYRSF